MLVIVRLWPWEDVVMEERPWYVGTIFEERMQQYEMMEYDIFMMLNGSRHMNMTPSVQAEMHQEIPIRNPDANSVDTCTDNCCLTWACSTCMRCYEVFCLGHMSTMEDVCVPCSAVLSGGDEDE
jgi:hypothetical protein